MDIQRLDWESSFFHKEIYRLHLGKTDTLETMGEKLDQVEADLVECLISAENFSQLTALYARGFCLVDIRYTLTLQFDGEWIKSFNRESLQGVFRQATIEDISLLKQGVSGLYKTGRFYNDAHFSKKSVETFYQAWLEKAVHGTFDHECYVYYDGESLVGFVSAQYNSDALCAKVGLVGICEPFQGKGYGKIVLLSILHQFFEKGIQRVEVVAQGNNIPAIRLYEGFGFKTETIDFWLHRWRSDLHESV